MRIMAFCHCEPRSGVAIRFFEDAGKTHGLLHFVRNDDGIMAKWP